MDPFVLLSRKRGGEELSAEEIAAVVDGAATASWTEAQLGAFLMATAIRGLSHRETMDLTRSMRDSGDCWNLAEAVPGLVDKHSTGGVGDTVTLILGPLLASVGVPTVMLTGRSLGHTGGTADKLESIPGLDLSLTRERTVDLLERTGLAIGIATEGIAPADRTLYRLRDQTATVRSLPLVIGSILSKKLAVGPARIVFDVKMGNGAIFEREDEARAVAQMLVDTSTNLGCPATALLTDMSQPLGAWVGHLVEVRGALEVLEGGGDPRLREVCLALAEEVISDRPQLTRARLEGALMEGRARAKFTEWATAQGGDAAWLASPDLDTAPRSTVLTAARSGVLAGVDTARLGAELSHLWKGDEGIDVRVGLFCTARLGDGVEAGEELARVFTERPLGAADRASLEACFEVGDEASPATLLRGRIDPN